MIIILNHKANLYYNEIIKYEKKLRKLDLIVIPTSCYLSVFQKGKYVLGAQDISEFKEFNRTGEINGNQLKKLNVKYCLVGHSDRRTYNKETNEILLSKLNRCFENDIIPLYCIGETSYENYKEELKQEIDLFYTYNKEKKHLLIYEPQKNIGNENADFSKLQEIINYIKNYIKEKYNVDIKLIYGGGVRTNNIEFIKSISGIDGLILSATTLSIDELVPVYKKAKK